MTNKDLWNRGDMSYTMHNYLIEQREKWVNEKKYYLEKENASAMKTVTYVTGVQSMFFNHGYAIYNESYQLVFLALKRVPGVARIIDYRLPQKMDLTKFKWKEKEFYQNPVGEVMDFQVGYDSGSNKFFLWQAMKYVVQFFDDYIPPIGALDQRPVGMNDEEWRMWVMINYNHNHIKFS